MSNSGQYPAPSGGVTEAAIVLHYRDDGPSGPCGQSTFYTSPWSRLYFYDNEDDATAYMRFLKAQPGSFAGRLRPRVEQYWFGEHVESGPIVPEGERV